MNYCINDCKAHECEIIELTSAPKTDAYYENMGFVWNGTTSRAGLKIYLKDLHTN